MTLVICIKTVYAKITKFSPCDASRTLVFSDKCSCPWVRGFPSNEGVKEGNPLKRRYFAAIGSYSVKTVADGFRLAAYIVTSTCDGLLGFVNIDDLEWPWTHQKAVLVSFLQFLYAAHILTQTCDEMAGDRPRQPAYKIFSTKRRFQQSRSQPFRFKEAGASERQRRLPLKSGYFTTIGIWLV